MDIKAVRLVKKLARIQHLTPAEERATAAAFNNSVAIVECVKDYLKHECAYIDKKLNDAEHLYSKSGADRLVAVLLAERSTYNKLLELLTQEAKVLDDDPSGEYNE